MNRIQKEFERLTELSSSLPVNFYELKIFRKGFESGILFEQERQLKKQGSGK